VLSEGPCSPLLHPPCAPRHIHTDTHTQEQCLNTPMCAHSHRCTQMCTRTHPSARMFHGSPALHSYLQVHGLRYIHVQVHRCDTRRHTPHTCLHCRAAHQYTPTRGGVHIVTNVNEAYLRAQAYYSHSVGLRMGRPQSPRGWRSGDPPLVLTLTLGGGGGGDGLSSFPAFPRHLERA
jgi:hypothetical protein